MIKVSLGNTELIIDTNQDYYGSQFWRSIESKKYEPDTLAFIDSNCGSNTDFMDVGAANGAMSILASLKGAKVYSYEPDKVIHDVFARNLELNKSILGGIKLFQKALSDVNTTIQFGARADSSILSSIVVTGDVKTIETVEVSSIVQEVNSLHTDQTRDLCIKMDIEGAEWRILTSEVVAKELVEHKTLLLLAVHPGFASPIPRLATSLLITRLPWLVMQYFESLRFHKHLSRFSIIMRTNLNPVNNKHKFALLVAAGYHEFVIDFDR